MNHYYEVTIQGITFDCSGYIEQANEEPPISKGFVLEKVVLGGYDIIDILKPSIVEEITIKINTQCI